MKSEASQNFPVRVAPVLDEAELSRLLAMAGPIDAKELMRRLIADISGVKSGMAEGMLAGDRVAIRRHSHVLLAIAGTIGADRVYELARVINLCAKDDDCTLARPHAAEVLVGLDGLVQHLRAMAAELGMAV